MTIRFVGGLWRRIDGNNVRSFCTYQEALDNVNCWEDIEPQATRDDIVEQLSKQ